MREVKAIMTKRSGKQINQPSSPTLHGEEVGSSKNKEQGNTSEDEAFKSQTKKYERIIIREGDYTHLTQPPLMQGRDRDG